MRKIAVWMMALGAIIFVGMLPSIILGSVERYQVVAPQRVNYRPSIKCAGTVYSREAYNILVSGLYQVEEAGAELGDTVAKGQLLARLKAAEKEKILYQETTETGNAPAGGLDPLAMAKAYGLDIDSLDGAGGYGPFQSLLEGEPGEEELRVYSPVQGRLTKEIPAQGSVVTSGSVLCAVEGTQDYYALLSVSEKEAGRIVPGSQVTLAGEGTGLAVCNGWVSKIRPGTRKELNGTSYQTVVDIEVKVEAENAVISPGFSVKAQVFTGDAEELVVLPYEAVRQDRENCEYVLVAKNHFLEKRPISTGLELADGVEILEGLSQDELVTVIGSLSEPIGEQPYLLEGR